MSMLASELGALVTKTLADPVVPEPWDSSPEIGVRWWQVRLPTGTLITGFDGLGVVLVDLVDGIPRVSWAIADAKGRGADERRAWIQSAIRAALGPGAIVLDAGRIGKRGAA